MRPTTSRRKRRSKTTPPPPLQGRGSRVGACPHPDEISFPTPTPPLRSEEHTSELQSLMRISYAVFCLKKKKKTKVTETTKHDKQLKNKLAKHVNTTMKEK